MNILPVHLLKLRWLLANVDHLNKSEHELVLNMQQSLEKVNYQIACPVTLVSLGKLFETTKRRLHVG